MRIRQPPHLLSRTLWCLILVATAATASVASSNNAPPLFSPTDAIETFVNERCGGTTGSAIWTFSGALYDPLDGHKICAVQGLELVRKLPATTSAISDLAIHQQLRQQQQQENQSVSTVLSRKLFCYHSEDSPKHVLKHIRLRPTSPLRKIPTRQAVVLYDVVTSFLGRGNKNELLVHSEFPNGATYWAKSSAVDPTTSNHMEFTVFTKKRPRDSLDVDLSETATTTTRSVSPKRSKLIQFGSDDKSSAKLGRFGARETYNYQIATEKPEPHPFWKFWATQQPAAKTTMTLKYTRHGEGPPWYGPNKVCLLELTGRRVDDISEAPGLVAQVASQLPGFLVVDTPISTKEQAQKALTWFRQDALQQELLLDQDDEQQQQLPSGWMQRGLHRVKRQGGHVWQQLRAASTVKPSTS